jgi:ATP-binding cassette subfamily B protein
LLITSVGRDLFSLIGLVGVMVLKDPLLSTATFIVFPPALFTLRKMIKRIRGIAKTQFTGGTRILETLQETLQGIRIVKAFTLEDVLRARFDANVAAVEREANKMARVASRSSPLMEILGGFAMAGVVIYGGYRVIENVASAGALFSFITAFLLAVEPAKRLARFNLPSGRSGDPRFVVRRRTGAGDRTCRPLGRGQIDNSQFDPALLRGIGRRDRD